MESLNTKEQRAPEVLQNGSTESGRLHAPHKKKNAKSIKYKKEYNAKLVECECGLVCRYSNLFRHYKSYKHTTYLENKQTQ